MPNYGIPANTNFILDAVVTDSDNDRLTYCWEQLDNELATMPPVSTSTEGPLFRSLFPTSNSSRNFPEEYGINTTWEVLPTVTREMNFGLTARDGNPEGIVSTNLSISVIDSGEQFSVTEPSSGSRYTQNSVQNITWNVAGTDSNEINTEFVKIELSYDNGLTFSSVLSESTANDGEELLIIPLGQATDDAKIRITAIDNIYYTISENPFVITEDIADDLAPIPNPVSDNILIQIFKLQVPQYEFTLYDITGRLLISRTLTSDTLVPEIESVDISGYNSGMYILKIILGSQIHTRKIIKE